MRSVLIILLTLIIVSCSGSKKVVENTTQASTQTKAPEVTDTDSKTEETEQTTSENSIENNTSEEEEEEPIVEHETTFELFDHSAYNTLLEKYVSNEGNVDYKGIKSEINVLKSYLASLSENMPDDTWTKEDKLAYWINAYNAMTIDLILRHYPIKSIKDIDKPWKQRYWKLGEKWYNLDEIEHQIIRKMGEPRIHFALVCAAVSCPKLYNKAFYATSLEDDLTLLTKAFLNDTSKNSISENDLRLSKIFSWFAKDFKQNGSLIDFLNQYTEITISDKAKKRFNDYNWELNE
ncbi:DUF547 domain-containing protein [Winogradskyella sp. 3972H.M.0a.05]|uniref:DUF547 domain-containing protein n=1 Tax=Winogradskyella sp. 3972H.M.0a.05 TaxID=2950277 RepID=UPI003392A98A